MDSGDFRQQYGNVDFGAAYRYTVAPVVYPVVNPAPAANYGRVTPGFSDVTGGSPAERSRTQQFQDRANMILGKAQYLYDKARDIYGDVKLKRDPSRRVPTTGQPVISGSDAPAGSVQTLAGEFTTGQKVFIGVLGILLLIGISKG